MSSKIIFLLTALVSLIVGALAMHLWQAGQQGSDASKAVDTNQPLYWVAPMDPNYRRDQPGKSPMGMDLVPVYADEVTDADESVGIVEITPQVVNNLGVRTAKVESRSLSSIIRTVGYVKYNESNLLHIHPRVSGWIEELYVLATGDPVKSGQVIYDLYSPELVSAQEDFLLAQRQTDKALLLSSKERLRALQISEKFIANLLKSKKVQRTVPFYAAQDGVIDKLEVRNGFYVTPVQNLMTIANLKSVWIEAEVFERDIASISAGQHVEVTTEAFPSKVWQGKIDYIYPTLRTESRTLRLRIGLDNPEEYLKPNMFTKLDIHTEVTQRLVVPDEAVIRTGRQDRVVLVMGDGKFKSVEVSLGKMEADYAEILDGLNEGDEVVTSAQFLLDSESSKTSDFMRMDVEDNAKMAWMKGTINEVMSNQRMLNISHDEVPEWKMSSMTMNFTVAQDVDMSGLISGQKLHFQATKTADGFLITMIHIMAIPEPTADIKEQPHADHSDH